MKRNSAWLGFFLLVIVLISTAARVGAQDRDRDDYDRDRRSGACFYVDANFGGDKFCLRGGERVSHVPPGFNDRISSIRIFGRTEITVYQDRDFGGASLRLRDDVANLQSYQIKPGHSWNDRVSSIEVDRGGDGGWDHDGGGGNGSPGRDSDMYRAGDLDRDGACFFKDADFRGDKFCVPRGDRMAQLPPGFSDQISSVRLYGRVTVTVYQDSNFGGPNLRLQQDVQNLQSYQVKPGHSWNDRISSIKVY